MFSSKSFRILLILVFAMVIGLFADHISARPADMFFLDWRQILANGGAPDIPVRVVDISGTSAKPRDSAKVNISKLVEALKVIARYKPKFIMLAISKAEVDIEKDSPEWKRLEAIGELYMLSDQKNEDKLVTLSVHPSLKLFPRSAKLMNTYDSKFDGVNRRNIIYFDLKRTPEKLSDNFEFIKKFLGKEISPDQFSKSFEYIGTEQVYLKIWPFEKFGNFQIDPISLDSEAYKGITDKVVIVTSFDIYSFLNVPSIVHRTVFKSGENLEGNFWSAGRMMATYITNLYSGDYVRQPTHHENAYWIAAWCSILMLSALIVEAKLAFLLGFIWIVVFVGISILMFKLTSHNFDMTRILVVSFLLQYLVVPIRLVRSLREQDRLEVERFAQIRAEKNKSRLLVKAASADMQLKVVAQVSHDIRSPLMALQIAHRVIKDGISQEAGELIQGSIERLKYIAEDTLMKFRNEASQRESDVVLHEALSDLRETFKVLYPEVEFRFNVSPDIRLLWPEHSLARAFTNLFNNSIEAYASNGKGLIITVSVEAKEDQYLIRVQDNGPGVPENIIPKLFQSGATFGKETGTGLGLYQVRKDLEDFGGRIRALKSAEGALFEITLPRYLEKIEVQVTRKIVAVAEVDLPIQTPEGVELIRLSTLQSARDYFAKFDDLSSYTLMLDLVFPSEEETAFDLIEALGSKKPFKTFISTSLGENEEIRKLSDRYDVLLVTKSLLSRFVFKFS